MWMVTMTNDYEQEQDDILVALEDAKQDIVNWNRRDVRELRISLITFSDIRNVLEREYHRQVPELGSEAIPTMPIPDGVCTQELWAMDARGHVLVGNCWDNDLSDLSLEEWIEITTYESS
jgi:hypothetical protein